jgi:hypothetical protein
VTPGAAAPWLHRRAPPLGASFSVVVRLIRVAYNVVTIFFALQPLRAPAGRGFAFSESGERRGCFRGCDSVRCCRPLVSMLHAIGLQPLVSRNVQQNHVQSAAPNLGALPPRRSLPKTQQSLAQLEYTLSTSRAMSAGLAPRASDAQAALAASVWQLLHGPPPPADGAAAGTSTHAVPLSGAHAPPPLPGFNGPPSAVPTPSTGGEGMAPSGGGGGGGGGAAASPLTETTEIRRNRP